MRPRARREFILDSGAVSFLASNRPIASGIVATMRERYDNPAIVLPIDNFAEAITGDPRRDAAVYRLLNSLAPSGSHTELVIYPTLPVATRAAALRTRAITSGAATAKRPISLIDAMLVALAEERSTTNAVTILTGDPADIQLLVGLTGATNIAVQTL